MAQFVINLFIFITFAFFIVLVAYHLFIHKWTTLRNPHFLLDRNEKTTRQVILIFLLFSSSFISLISSQLIEGNFAKIPMNDLLLGVAYLMIGALVGGPVLARFALNHHLKKIKKL